MSKVISFSSIKIIFSILSTFIFLVSFSTKADVNVNIDISQPEHHLAQVTLSFDKTTKNSIDFHLPTWRTGRYEILNLANGIRDFSAVVGRNKTLQWRKVDKDTWRVSGTSNKKVTISYQVYANELGKRTRHIDDSHAFIDASTVVMYSDDSRNQQHKIKLHVPKGWNSVSGLSSAGKARRNKHKFIAKNYDQLVDSPIETGINEHYKFTVEKRKYELVIWGKGNYNSKKMLADLAVMVKQAKHIWQDYPFKRYVFMVHATSGARGATEHINSTIIQRSRYKFSDRKDYLGFISTAAHEFVHTWNVKQYRAKGLVPYDYQQENYSNLLWLAEGSTSYLQYQLLLRGELMTTKEFLASLAKRITGYIHKPGRDSQSVADTSFNKWIEQGGDYGRNFGVNIYSEGFLVSWLLDFNILAQTQLNKSYRDVHQQLYQDYRIPKTFTDTDVQAILKTVTGHDYSTWWQMNVEGFAKPDFDQLLAQAGLKRSYGKLNDDNEITLKAWSGISTTSDKQGVTINSVERNSPAWQAGLSIGDSIIAIDGLRLIDIDLKKRLKNFAVDDKVVMTIFRRDQLMEKTITLAAIPKVALKIEPIEQATEQQKAFFKAWTGLEFPKE